VTVTVTVLMLVVGGGGGHSKTVRVGEPRTWRLSIGTVSIETDVVEPAPVLVDRVVPGGVLYEDVAVIVMVTVLMLIEGVKVGQGHSQTERVGEPRD